MNKVKRESGKMLPESVVDVIMASIWETAGSSGTIGAAGFEKFFALCKDNGYEPLEETASRLKELFLSLQPDGNIRNDIREILSAIWRDGGITVTDSQQHAETTGEEMALTPTKKLYYKAFRCWPERDLSPEGIPELLAVLDTLREREAQALKMRFGLTGDRATYSAIGKEFGVTAERARQIVLGGTRKLRLPSRRKRIESLFSAPEK